MPQVPTYDNLTTNLQAANPGSFSAPAPTNFAAQQAQQVGAAAMQAGDTALGIATDIQEQANQLRVDDAVNKAREHALQLTFGDNGYSKLTGEAALNRPSGKPLADEYADQLKDQMGQISAGLGNNAQREAFARQAQNIQGGFYSSVMSHTAEQFRNYGISVRQGTIDNRTNEIGLNYRNPAAVEQNVKSIQAAVYDLGRIQGWSGEETQAKMQQATSQAHKLAISSALQDNNLGYATAYVNHFGDQMDAQDLLQVRGYLTREQDSQIALKVSTDVMQKYTPQLQNSDFDRAFNILVGAESGGKQMDANGQPLTSPKGAIGAAQVMPTTAPEAAELAGLPWDENLYKTNADYNKALGAAYFKKQVQAFGGDLAKAYAAYNAGPQAVKDAITASQKDGTDWLSKVPAETQNYVTNNLNAYANGAGKYQMPTLLEMQNDVRERMGPLASPTRLKAALDETERQYSAMKADITQRQAQTKTDALQQIMQNGGNFNALPISVRGALAPEDAASAMDFAKKISTGQDVTTDLYLYNQLTNNPKMLTGMSDAQFYATRTALSTADFKHFSDLRAKASGSGIGSSGPGDLDTSAIKNILDNRLDMSGIVSNPPSNDREGQQQIGGIRQFVDQYLLTAQKEAGHKFKQDEIQSQIDQLFARNITLQGMFNKGDKKSIMQITTGDIPDEDLTQIKGALSRRGFTNPTDAQILNLYRMGQVAKK
jgi:soluble lytic murein transglycosylase